jgi:hypothetical protein
MEKKSAVTPERFAKGFTYADYIAQIKVNKDQFERFYAAGELSADDVRFFKKTAQAKGGVAKILALGEDWCPDVFRGLPAMARIAEAAGVELRMFPRDSHPDIMNEFLNKGQFMSIPVCVFYTKDLKEICRWTERPEAANKERAQIEEATRKEMPAASEQDLRMAMRERLAGKQPAWQKESVREMRAMLAEKLGIK